MTIAPSGLCTSISAACKTTVSRPEKIGPIIIKVRSAVIITVQSGVIKRSSISGTWSWNHFSILLMQKTERMTGMTWP